MAKKPVKYLFTHNKLSFRTQNTRIHQNIHNLFGENFEHSSDFLHYKSGAKNEFCLSFFTIINDNNDAILLKSFPQQNS